MGKSEKHADCIQSPEREEYEKTTLVQKGKLSGNLVPLLLRPPVTVPGIFVDCIRSPISQTSLEEPHPTGSREISPQQGEISS